MAANFCTEHTDRVRNRVTALEGTVNMSSGIWILDLRTPLSILTLSYRMDRSRYCRLCCRFFFSFPGGG